MEFDQYVEMITVSALKTKHYDPAGNGGLATYNKTFLTRLRHSCKILFREVKKVVNQPFFDWRLGDFFAIILIVPLSPVYVVIATFSLKAKIKKELKEQWLHFLRSQTSANDE
jgi:hypothetical protein